MTPGGCPASEVCGMGVIFKLITCLLLVTGPFGEPTKLTVLEKEMSWGNRGPVRALERLNGRTEWVSRGTLVSKLIASFQQGSGLITMNWIAKLAAGLRCPGQEPTSCGAQPGISVSMEVLLIGAPEITQQQLPAAGNSKSCCRNRYICRFFFKKYLFALFCELLTTEE